ncbi:MAG: hypothetical protein ACK6BC_08675 [Cyanobacteriota bacterium]
MTPPPPPANTPLEPSPPAAARPLSGRRVVAAGVVAGIGALAIALFLRALVANTPVRVSSFALFWGTVLVGSFGLVAGMAVEAVRQLRDHNPDPAYHRGGRGRGSV